MPKYVAFLRGINVGGNKQIKMDALQRAFLSWKFVNVKTLLASGNVLFETKNSDASVSAESIEKNIKKTFGRDVNVILRSFQQIQDLFDANPFKNVKVTPQTRLYVTFLSEKPKTHLKIPCESPQKNFKIFRVSNNAVFSVLTLLPNFGTIESMAILEKEFGRKITTRNWNTITKILKS